MRCHSGLRMNIARRGHGVDALEERHRMRRYRRRVPAQLGDDRVLLVARRSSPEACIDLSKAPGVLYRRTNAIEPRTLVSAARRGERRPGKLLGIKAISTALRRISTDGQRPGQRLRLEAVAEARHVTLRFDCLLRTCVFHLNLLVPTGCETDLRRTIDAPES